MTADHITVSHQRLVAAGVAERSAAEPSARCLWGHFQRTQHRGGGVHRQNTHEVLLDKKH